MGAGAFVPRRDLEWAPQTLKGGQVTPPSHPLPVLLTPTFLACSKDGTAVGEDSEMLHVAEPDLVVLIFETGSQVAQDSLELHM